MQSAGYLVSTTAELTAGMKNRKHDLNRRNSGLLLNADRNSAAIINDGNGIISIDGNLNLVAETG